MATGCRILKILCPTASRHIADYFFAIISTRRFFCFPRASEPPGLVFETAGFLAPKPAVEKRTFFNPSFRTSQFLTEFARPTVSFWLNVSDPLESVCPSMRTAPLAFSRMIVATCFRALLCLRADIGFVEIKEHVRGQFDADLRVAFLELQILDFAGQVLNFEDEIQNFHLETLSSSQAFQSPILFQLSREVRINQTYTGTEDHSCHALHYEEEHRPWARSEESRRRYSLRCQEERETSPTRFTRDLAATSLTPLTAIALALAIADD